MRSAVSLILAIDFSRLFQWWRWCFVRRAVLFCSLVERSSSLGSGAELVSFAVAVAVWGCEFQFAPIARTKSTPQG